MPYKQGVTGSNPVVPTNKTKGFRQFKFETLFYLHKICTKTTFILKLFECVILTYLIHLMLNCRLCQLI